MRALLTFALFLSGCAQPNPRVCPIDQSVLPKELQYYVGGAWGGGCAVSFKGEMVTLERLAVAGQKSTSERPRTFEIRPDQGRWERFWRQVTILRVFEWRDNYKPADLGATAFDGSQWSLKLVHGEKRVISRGDNAYPSAGNVKVTSFDDERLRMFEAALADLIGYPLE